VYKRSYIVLTVSLGFFFVGQKIILSTFNMDSRQGRIFCTRKNLKGTVNRVEKQSFFLGPRKKLVWSDKLQCLPNANPNAKK
jgi:hypothetical protein